MAVDRKGRSAQDVRAELGKAIKAARGDWSQEQLAEEIGVPQSTVSQWERGRLEPSISEVLAIETKRGLPRGNIFRAAGLVAEGDQVTVEEAIQGAPELDGSLKLPLIAVYRSYLALVPPRRPRGQVQKRKRG